MKYKLELNGRTYEVEVELADPMRMQEFRSYAPVPAASTDPVVEPVSDTTAAAAPLPVTGDGECVASPMPGNILKVLVAAGQTVKEGDVLVILEAMKMENEIVAPHDGTVTQVVVEKGSTVETDAPLVFLR